MTRIIMCCTIFLFVSVLSNNTLNAQGTLQWRALPSAPFMSSSRIDDLTFVNPNIGWVANGRGQIYKTTNGGGTWINQFDKNTVYFRCLTFADSLRGWACNLGTEEFGGATDTNIIYQTTNGGENWFPNNNMFPTKPRGLCGIQAFDDSCIYAVGRVRGPAFFVRSTNGGNTWETRNMSAFAMGLLDVYFFSKDSGFAVGHNGDVNSTSNGVVLFTSDRGNTWSTRYVTSRIGEWCWKISFTSRQTGYISLQRNSGGPVNILKTTDGGLTWQEKLFQTGAYYVQGIGFGNDTKGWIGGNSSLPTYATTNGGETWFSEPFGVRVNRFQMFGDTLGYAVGQTVYKYSTESPTSTPERKTNPSSFALLQMYPNPFNSQTTIQYTISGGAEDPATPLDVTITLFDLLGRQVATILSERHRFGTYQTKFDGAGLASGTYIVRMQVMPGHDGGPSPSGRYTDQKKLILLK